MRDKKLFLGPGYHLIVPSVNPTNHNTYIQNKVPWGWWYFTNPFELSHKASYLEIYILTEYEIGKPPKKKRKR